MISGRPRPLASSSLGFIRRRDDDDNDVHVDSDDWNRRIATDLRISAVQIRGCCRSRAIWRRSWSSGNHLIIETFGRNFKCREYDTASIKRSPQPPRFRLYITALRSVDLPVGGRGRSRLRPVFPIKLSRKSCPSPRRSVITWAGSLLFHLRERRKTLPI